MSRRPGAAALLASVAKRAGRPLTVVFQVTDRCNYDCIHCYETHGDEDELGFAEIDRILGELAAAGVFFVNFTGGEFFMRRDADDLLRAARRRKFALRLLTTGHFIDDRRADLIAELGSIEVSMSFYSAEANVHEHITRVKGSWQRTLDAARRLRARGVHVTLKSPVMNVNVDGMAALEALAGELGCEFNFDPKVTAREDGDACPTSLRASDEAIAAFYRHQLGMLRETYAGAAEDHDPDRQPCVAGVLAVGIDPQGIVTACHTIPIPAGDLKKQSFLDIWETSPELARVRGLTWSRIDECNTCDVRPWCQRCHAMAHLEDGDLAGPSREACRHAVLLRDLLREEGLVPADHTALPPPLARDRNNRPVRIRPAALRVIA